MEQMSEERTDPWCKDLEEVGKDGAEILEVWAISEPDAEKELIAKIYLDSDLIRSNFGDTRFYFQHVRTKRDFKYMSGATKTTLKSIHPLMDEVEHEWDVSAWPTTSEEDAEDYYMDQVNTYGCPFAWLLYDDNETDPAL